MVSSQKLSRENLNVDGLWAKVLNNSPQGIVILKALRNEDNDIEDFEYLHLNDQAQKFLNLQGEDLSGNTVFSRYPSTDGKGILKMYAEVVETGIPADYEIFYDGDGFQNWFRVTASKLEDGLTIMFDDITRSKNAQIQLAGQKQLLEEIYNGTSDALVLLKPLEDESGIYDFRYEMINRAGGNMLQKSPSEIIGKTVLELYPGSVREKIFHHYVEAARDGAPFDREFFYEHEGLKNYFRQRGIRLAGNLLVITTDVSGLKQAEIELSESKNFIQSIADNSPGLLYLYNLQEKKLLYINNKVQEFFGYAREGACMDENGLSALIHADDKEAIQHYFSGLDSADKGQSIEFRVRHAHGNWVWLRSFNTIFSKDSEGNPLLLIGNAENITEKKVTEDEMQKLKALVDNSSDFIALADAGGRVEYVNKGGREMAGLESGEERSTSILDYFCEPDKKFISEALLPVVRKEGQWSGEVSLCHFKTRMPFPVLWNVFMVENVGGKPDGIGCIGQDISYRKEFEKELISLNNRLEGRVKKRTAELESKNNQLRQINEDLDNFIYTASHDLKAPISNIEGLMNAFEDMIQGNDSTPEELMEIVSLVNVSVKRFKKTIQNLAEITKVQKDIDNDRSDINVTDALDELTAELNRLIEDKDVTIVSDSSSCPVICFSRINFRSILYNLLTNAIHYSHPERKPVIEIKCQEVADAFLIEVKDNGLGIPGKDRLKLFSMFKRFHTHVEGTGIGLYIVKRIVDNAGGKIEIESEEGTGSTFKVFLPRN